MFHIDGINVIYFYGEMVGVSTSWTVFFWGGGFNCCMIHPAVHCRNCYPWSAYCAVWRFGAHLKGAIQCQLNWAILLSYRHTWRKNWVNSAVLTDNSARLRTALSSRLSHTELRSSLRESHSFLSLPADTSMASSQGSSVSSNSFSRWASHDIFLFKYHVLLHILRFFPPLFG
jgi:hypothetical protein